MNAEPNPSSRATTPKQGFSIKVFYVLSAIGIYLLIVCTYDMIESRFGHSTWRMSFDLPRGGKAVTVATAPAQPYVDAAIGGLGVFVLGLGVLTRKRRYSLRAICILMLVSGVAMSLVLFLETRAHHMESWSVHSHQIPQEALARIRNWVSSDRLRKQLPDSLRNVLSHSLRDGWTARIEQSGVNMTLALDAPSDVPAEVWHKEASYTAIVYWTAVLEEIRVRDGLKVPQSLDHLDVRSFRLLACWDDGGVELMKACLAVMSADSTSVTDQPVEDTPPPAQKQP